MQGVMMHQGCQFILSWTHFQAEPRVLTARLLVQALTFMQNLCRGVGSPDKTENTQVPAGTAVGSETVMDGDGIARDGIRSGDGVVVTGGGGGFGRAFAKRF